MQSDAPHIAQIYQRVRLLDTELKQLQGNWYSRAWHIALAHDGAIYKETLTHYSAVVPLNQQAIIWGIGCGFAGALLIELLLLILLSGSRHLLIRGYRRLLRS